MGLFTTTDEWKARAEKAEAELDQYNAIDNSAADQLSDVRARLDQAEKLYKAGQIARTPEGMKALADKVALQVDDLYAFGGTGVAGRRDAVALRVANALTIALTGGDREFY